MKTILSSIKSPIAARLKVCFALAAFLGLLALPTQAQYLSFHPTNVLTTNWVSGFPTNVVSTNGLGQGTGGAIDVGNNEFVLLCVSGYVCTNINLSLTNEILDRFLHAPSRPTPRA